MTCTSGSVTGVDLSFLSVPASTPLPPAVATLYGLGSIQLNGNGLVGSLLPELSALTSLTLLRVDNNALSGELPSGWSSLSRLVTLNLGANQLTGSIPGTWPAGMTALTRLTVSNNAAVCGPLPAPWTSSQVTFVGSNVGVLCPGPPPPPQPPSPQPPSPPSPPGTFSVLLALKAAMTTSWPSALSDWQEGSDPCTDGWTGVVCDAGNVDVVEVDLVSCCFDA